ncbi:ABC transporter substrate-binding protein [Aestuariirhabdus litorea]|uniref:Amino acid ABC transporter substrate-binding protein n=1 Tax=Aestuariirhabdus litorea TaxID=2528527 RepID=A0A3P3VNS1_9GAMM|nr:ABC transporter substrate-binding protein [Aestuariirhabdus litorea]RRJ84260.1 amino acid ABC transporter substrate-binding protein [Aestuariirhabdus litorea]RWW97482.1 amino acid ABC transporter substrate-binding protein [Endozoicomonadaceae bacterium GTF-13]
MVQIRRLFNVAVLLSAGLILGCSEPAPLKLGVAAGLTGVTADLGREARDGVMLAVEHANAAGGVNGRPIELLVRDDRNTPETALKVDRELIDAGVIAVIGHVTSAMSVAAVPQMNEHEVLMLSPTTSTNLLTGKKDFFLRVYEEIREESLAMADYAFNSLQARDVAIIYDFRNRAFSEGWGAYFKEQFIKRGGRVSFEESYSEIDGDKFLQLGAAIIDPPHDLVLILAPALDAARLSQQMRKLGYGGHIMTSAWSTTNDLISQGGTAVEGVVSPSAFNRDSTIPRFTHFRDAFVARFNYEPRFAGTMAYEAAEIIFQAMRSMSEADLAAENRSERLRDRILNQSRFEGLQGAIVFDPYGEVDRTNFLVQVRNGQFVIVDD